MKEYPTATFKNIIEDVKNYTMAFEIEEVSDGRCRIIGSLFYNYTRIKHQATIEKVFIKYFPIQEKEQRLEKLREIFNLVIQVEEKKKEINLCNIC